LDVRTGKARKLEEDNQKSRENGEEKMTENKKKPNPIDIHVGSRIRLRRNMLGMSQEKLGESLGITFQQIQKYEKGTNRVGASRLQAIASILNVSVAFFFENAPGLESSSQPGLEEHSADYVADFCSSAEGLQLNRAFVKIGDPKVRRKVIDLVKALGADEDA
jgi:transcriptional regulator with XRE-family HTH domain